MQTTLYDDLYEVRRAVQEAFSKESVFVPERSQMLNALQGILEKCESAQGGMVEVDFEDLFVLYKNRDVIKDAAHIHDAFMGNHDLANSLRQIVKNIEEAQAHHWVAAQSGA